MPSLTQPASPRALALIHTLALQPHPEGGWYREVFRATGQVQPADDRSPRSALTCIDFLLCAGQCSAWHRVQSDEAWHLLEGAPLRLWLLPPDLSACTAVVLQPVGSAPSTAPRHVVPAGWWQAAEPLGDFSFVGATVGPGFEFADFAFGRDTPSLRAALQALAPELRRLL
jgi:predicted cupin superfamily sugar epimerase